MVRVGNTLDQQFPSKIKADGKVAVRFASFEVRVGGKKRGCQRWEASFFVFLSWRRSPALLGALHQPTSPACAAPLSARRLALEAGCDVGAIIGVAFRVFRSLLLPPPH
jgi:hypothetical protein